MFARVIAIVVGLCLAAAETPAATFSLLHNFGVLTNVTGFNPQSQLVQGPDGTLYGTAAKGEGAVRGVVFRVGADGKGFTWLKLFMYTNAADGQYPEAGVVLSGNMLYGTTAAGGTNNTGTVFAVGTNGAGFMTLHTFAATNGPAGTNSDGANPLASLVVSNGRLYGTTWLGGTNGFGTVFSLQTNGAGFTALHTFSPTVSYEGFGIYTNADGANPAANLILAGGTLYGTAQNGGTNGLGAVFALSTNGTGFVTVENLGGNGVALGAVPESGLLLSGNLLYGAATGGTVFALNTNGTGFTLLHSFTYDDGSSPMANLVLAGNTLYGTAPYGGTNGGGGVLFRVNVDGSGFTNFYNFGSTVGNDGYYPMAGLVLSNSTLFGTTYSGGSGLYGTAFAVSTNGTGFTNLASFGFSDAAYPLMGLALAGNRLYGVTENGGAGYGTVFALDTNGANFANLRSFTNRDGAGPNGTLTLSGGTMYGTTVSGGAAGKGTVFAISTNGMAFTNLFSFATTKGNNGTNATGVTPEEQLWQSGGTLYGTAFKGATNGAGAVFAIGTNGTGFSLLYAFSMTNSGTGANRDGAGPSAGVLLLGNTLYGLTELGGAGGVGALFAINTNGTAFTNDYSFSGGDGALPEGKLLFDGSRLYGTAANGGTGYGTVFAVNTNGTGFTVLHAFTATNGPSFTNGDGAYPLGGLALSGTTLYGITLDGGSGGYGTVFEIQTDGQSFTTLHNFGFTNGALPTAGLVLSGDTLYGATGSGGSVGDGVLFSLTVAPELSLQLPGGKAVLNWSDPTFSLQSATNVTGPFLTLPGATSPYTNTIIGSKQFFRLLGN